jgi:hypothetical protein
MPSLLYQRTSKNTLKTAVFSLLVILTVQTLSVYLHMGFGHMSIYLNMPNDISRLLSVYLTKWPFRPKTVILACLWPASRLAYNLNGKNDPNHDNLNLTNAYRTCITHTWQYNDHIVTYSINIAPWTYIVKYMIFTCSWTCLSNTIYVWLILCCKT